MSYKLIKNFEDSELPVNAVLNLNTGGYIPFDPANTDYQEYLEWVAEGNTPEPADE